MSALLCLASVGRSGSTFLQRLLNTHPDIVLFGEHEGFLRGIRAAYQMLSAPRTVALLETGHRRLDAILGAEPVTDAPGGWSIEWTNALRPADVAPSFARFVKDLVYPQGVRALSHRYWGFKEIRYGAEDLHFLETVFPEARFLVLARDPMAVYRSQCRLEWGQQAGAEKAAETFHRDFSALADAWDAQRAPAGTCGNTQLVCYEQLVADPLGHLDRIATWLGVAPFNEEKALAVAAAHMTPQRERWTPESESFLGAYLSTHAEEDRRRYRAMRAGAIGAGTYEPEAAPAQPGSARPTASGGPEPRKLVFLHIPMTGGSTLHEQISKAFEVDEICPYRFGFPQECSAQELERYRFFSGHFSPDDIRRIPGEKFVFTVLRDPVKRLLALCNFGAGNPPGGATPEAGSATGSAVIPFRRAAGGNPRHALDNDMARQLAGAIGVAADGGYVRDEGGVRTRISGADVVRLAVANLRLFDFVGFTDELDTAYARIADEFGLSQAPGALPRLGASSVASGSARPPGIDGLLEAESELSRLTELDRQVFAWVRSGQTPPALAYAPLDLATEDGTGLQPAAFAGAGAARPRHG